MYAQYKSANCETGGVSHHQSMSTGTRTSEVDQRLAHDVAKLKPIVMSGPSGGGKSTLLKILLQKYPDCFGFSVSHTTRQPRPGEQHGKDYYYVSREEFAQMKEDGEFIESTEFSGNCYGTSKRAVAEVLEAGRMCILDVDVQGVKNVKELGIPASFVFIKPPSMEILEQRLRGRGTETEEKVLARLRTAQEALDYAEIAGVYDLIVVNDNLDTAYTVFEDYFLPTIKQLLKTKEANK